MKGGKARQQASRPDRAGMLALSDQEFKTTIINMLSALMDKVGGTQEQTGNASRELDILKTNKQN